MRRWYNSIIIGSLAGLLAIHHHVEPVSSAVIRGRISIVSPKQRQQQHFFRALQPQRPSPQLLGTISIPRGGADPATAAAAPIWTTLSSLHKDGNYNLLLAMLTKDVVAKAACVFFMGQSTTAWLAPHRTCLKYGLTTSVLNVACNRKLATAYLASAVLMYGMLFQKCTAHTAVGAAAVAWMMEQLKARLYYEAEDIGRPVWSEYAMGAAATLTAMATLWTGPKSAHLARLAIQSSSLLLLINGVLFFLAPAALCRFWKISAGIITSPDVDEEAYKEERKRYNETVFLHRYMGVAVIFSGIMQAVLGWGGDIYQAIGSAFGFLFMINCWSFLKTSDFKRLARTSLSVSSRMDLKKKLSKLFFPMFNAVVSAVLLLSPSMNASGGGGGGSIKATP